MTESKHTLLSRTEAAKFLGVKAGTLEVWASTGRYDLPIVKIGRLAKYRLSDLQKFIDQRATTCSEPQRN
jgi:excisionase family DNA binding protein